MLLQLFVWLLLAGTLAAAQAQEPADTAIAMYACPYVAIADTPCARELPMADLGETTHGLTWTSQEVPGNRAVVAVYGFRVSPEAEALFEQWNCEHLKIGEAKSLLSQHVPKPYCEDGQIKFADGQGGRPSEARPPQGGAYEQLYQGESETKRVRPQIPSPNP